MVSCSGNSTKQMAALKRKLKAHTMPLTKTQRSSNTTGAVSKKSKKTKPLVSKAVSAIKVSTKHNAGRRALCDSLNQALMSSSGLNESLRGMNQQPVLSAEERVQRKMEEREQAAVRFEQHQELMSQAVDDLAQLMSGGGTNQ